MIYNLRWLQRTAKYLSENKTVNRKCIIVPSCKTYSHKNSKGNVVFCMDKTCSNRCDTYRKLVGVDDLAK